MRPGRIALITCCIVLLAAPVLAHVPAFAADNTSPGTAHRIPDADKSWSVYDRLEGDRVTYYEFEREAGDRLLAGLFTASDGPFTPSLVVMGPGIEGDPEGVPDRVEVPDGTNATVIDGQKAEPSYEPFTPAANYRTVDYDRRVEEGGRYVLAVYEPDRRSGAVGVIVGHQEEFGPLEYLTVPFDLVRVYLWEGDHPLVVFGPIAAALLAGLAYARQRRESDGWERAWLRYPLAFAASLLVGTAATMLLEMVLALAVTGLTTTAVVTAILVVVPAGSGGWLLWTATRPEFELDRRTRIGLFLAGLGGLVAWGGLVVAPLIALVAAAIPRSVARPGGSTLENGDGA
jgi:hypothetical protein